MIYELIVRKQRDKSTDKKSQLLGYSSSQRLSLILLVFFFSFLASHFSFVHAANPKKELSEIERKLKERKKQVKEAIEQERSILSEVDNINKIIKKKQDELIGYEKRISQAQLNIKILEDEIIMLTAQMEQKKLNLRVRLKGLYKQQYWSRALVLITAKDYQELINKSKYLNLIAYHDRRTIDKFNSELSEANKKKKDLELMREALSISKESAKKKQKEMKIELTKKDKLLASVRNKRSSYEQMIRELEESSEKLREMIETLAKEKTPAVKGRNFGALKGRLPWPISGDVIIPYGKYNDPQYNITTFKNGIEINADSNGEPKAVSEGSVVYADWFKGYGLLLIINHGSGYHSLYGHLSEIFYKSGDIIKKGDVVGRIGNSGVLDVPSLYFEIRHKGKPVNPMQWLKRK